MMQAAISTGAHWLDRVVTTPAISGSIAALASCNSSTPPAKISSGRWRSRWNTLVASASGTSRATRAVGLRDVDLRPRMRDERQQCRDRQQEGDEEYRLARQTGSRTRPSRAAAEPLPSEAKRALRPSRSPIASGPTRPRLIAAIAGPSTQLASACSVAAAVTTGKIGHSA